MIHQAERAVNQRVPIRYYHPENAPRITAAVTYQDLSLGIVAHSIRSSLGVMRASTAIHFDASVFDHLITDGVMWLECHIKDTNTTYRAPINTMIKHGQLQQRYGLQRVLSLKYWSVNGEKPGAMAQSLAKDEPRQGTLFDLVTGKRKAVHS